MCWSFIRGVSDVIPSTVVTAAMLEVYCAAAAKRCNLMYMRLQTNSQNIRFANNFGKRIFRLGAIRLLLHAFSGNFSSSLSLSQTIISCCPPMITSHLTTSPPPSAPIDAGWNSMVLEKRTKCYYFISFSTLIMSKCLCSATDLCANSLKFCIQHSSWVSYKARGVS